MNQPGFTVWLTGLPFSGKKHLGFLIDEHLETVGFNTQMLVGSMIRRLLEPELGFSREEVAHNVKRICYECKLLNDSGVVVVAATVSPFRDLREECRERIGRFVEVYCRAPLEVLKKRDTKGLYRRAERGEIANLAGVSIPYEEPLNPEVIFQSDRETAENALLRVMAVLRRQNYLNEASRSVLTQPEEESIRSLLKKTRR